MKRGVRDGALWCRLDPSGGMSAPYLNHATEDETSLPLPVALGLLISYPAMVSGLSSTHPCPLLVLHIPLTSKSRGRSAEPISHYSARPLLLPLLSHTFRLHLCMWPKHCTTFAYALLLLSVYSSDPYRPFHRVLLRDPHNGQCGHPCVQSYKIFHALAL